MTPPKKKKKSRASLKVSRERCQALFAKSKEKKKVMSEAIKSNFQGGQSCRVLKIEEKTLWVRSQANDSLFFSQQNKIRELRQNLQFMTELRASRPKEWYAGHSVFVETDGEWARGQVLSLNPKQECAEVLYGDIGGVGMVALTDLLPLPQELASLPFLSICLPGLRQVLPLPVHFSDAGPSGQSLEEIIRKSLQKVDISQVCSKYIYTL